MERFGTLLFSLSGLAFIVLSILVFVSLVKKQWHKAKKLSFICLGVFLLTFVIAFLTPRPSNTRLSTRLSTRLITDPNKAYEFIDKAVASTGEAVYPGVAAASISPEKAIGCDNNFGGFSKKPYADQRHFSSGVFYRYPLNGSTPKYLLKTVADYWKSRGYVIDRKDEFNYEPELYTYISNTADKEYTHGAFTMSVRVANNFFILYGSAPCLDGTVDTVTR